MQSQVNNQLFVFGTGEGVGPGDDLAILTEAGEELLTEDGFNLDQE